MKNQIYISWGPGKEAMFYLPGFFPCTQAKLKKFVNLMMEDYENRDENINTCIRYLEDTIENLDASMQELKHQYNKMCSSYEYEKQRVTDRTHTNGLPLKRGELKDYKYIPASEKTRMKNINEKFRSEFNTRKKLMSNIERLKKLCDVD